LILTRARSSDRFVPEGLYYQESVDGE
jgi:hypothetical protein